MCIRDRCYLFVCVQTEAVHFELTTLQSANSFFNALSNFIFRQGCLIAMHSDNDEKVVFFSSFQIWRQTKTREKYRCRWNSNPQRKCIRKFCPLFLTRTSKQDYIPPRAPHIMGSLWSAGVELVNFLRSYLERFKCYLRLFKIFLVFSKGIVLYILTCEPIIILHFTLSTVFVSSRTAIGEFCKLSV